MKSNSAFIIKNPLSTLLLNFCWKKFISIRKKMNEKDGLVYTRHETSSTESLQTPSALHIQRVEKSLQLGPLISYINSLKRRTSQKFGILYIISMKSIELQIYCVENRYLNVVSFPLFYMLRKWMHKFLNQNIKKFIEIISVSWIVQTERVWLEKKKY